MSEIRSLFEQAIWYLYEEMEGRDEDVEFEFDYEDVRKLEKEFDSAFKKLEESRCR